MSSLTTRDEVKAFLTANSLETIIDMSGEFRDLINMLEGYGVARTDDWVGIQFVGNTEEYISVMSKCFREYGTITFHVVAPIEIGGLDAILARCETIRSLFRGIRINDIAIESVSPPNTEIGTTLEFENTFTSATFFVDYYRDIKI